MKRAIEQHAVQGLEHRRKRVYDKIPHITEPRFLFFYLFIILFFLNRNYNTVP